MRSTLKPEFLAMSVAFDDQGEIVPGLGITTCKVPTGPVDSAGPLLSSCFKRLSSARESWSHP
jgi:hypothetical protein